MFQVNFFNIPRGTSEIKVLKKIALNRMSSETRRTFLDIWIKKPTGVVLLISSFPLRSVEVYPPVPRGRKGTISGAFLDKNKNIFLQVLAIL